MIVPKTTKVLDTATRASLLSYDPSTGELRFGPSATLGGLKADDVLVTQPLPPLAPYGFLRKVVSVQTVGQDTVVQTVPAMLTEAIHQGAFQIDQPLKPSMLASSSIALQGVTLQSDAPSEVFTFSLDNVILYDADGNHSTTNDQVRASGSFTLDPTLQISAGLHFHFCCDVQSRFRFAIGVDQSVHVTLNAAAGYTVKKQVDIGSMTFSPITIWVGPVPVVFVPKLAIVASFDGNLSAHLTFTASESLHLLAGTDKPYGKGFHDISTAKLSGSSSADNLLYQYPSVTFSMKPAIGAQFRILVYDLVGPQAGLNAYVRVDGKMPGNPVWKAYAGIQGTLGLHVAVLDYNWDKTIFDTSVQIGQETGNTPPQLDAGDVTPADGSQVQLGVPVGFYVRARDAEDGTLGNGTWVLGSGAALTLDANHQHTFDSPGPRTITVTVTDSAGASASTPISITVVDTPPVAIINNPPSGDVAYDGVNLPTLRGSAVDANEPGGQLDCSKAVWTSNYADDGLPTDACPYGSFKNVTFHGTGVHTLTLTATDPQGESDVRTTTVNVVTPPANIPPDLQIISPTTSKNCVSTPCVTDYEPLDLQAKLADPDDDTLSYTWTLTDPSNATTTLVSGTATGASTVDGSGHLVGVDVSDTGPAVGCSGVDVDYTLTLSATDSAQTKTKSEVISCSYVPR